MRKIFVQIASYRDPELVPTLRDMFKKAKNPQSLNVCIAWQYSQEDKLEEFLNHPQVKIIYIDYKDSKGACWARNLIQKFYSEEEFTLQIDSHTRFIKNWDLELISIYDSLKLAGYQKPLLTGYVDSYNPENYNDETQGTPMETKFDKFTDDGIVLFYPEHMPDHILENENIIAMPARFYSGHFCFTQGIFCKEVPHDENLYFFGEEITLSVRAFTWGYDMFHPKKHIVWHQYGRNGSKKHWDDHFSWQEIDNKSRENARILLGMQNKKTTDNSFLNKKNFISKNHNTYNKEKNKKQYGIGKARLIREYELYTGICFNRQSVDPYRINMMPGSFTIQSSYEDWMSILASKIQYEITLPYDSIPLQDCEFLCVAFLDENGNDLFRKDAYKKEIDDMIEKNNISIKRYFYPISKPVKWRIWPYSKNKKWLDVIEGNI